MKSSLKKHSIKLLAMIMIFSSFTVAASAATNVKTSQANLFSFTGNVTISQGGAKTVKAFNGMRLQSGYSVKTGASSGAYISIDSDKVLRMDQNTNVKLSKVSGNKINISLVSGKIFNDIKNKLPEGAQYTVTTANSVMGVRGTVFSVGANAVRGSDGTERVSTQVMVFEGAVAMEDTVTKNKIDVPQGQQAVNQSVAAEAISKPLAAAPIADTQISSFEGKALKEVERNIPMLENKNLDVLIEKAQEKEVTEQKQKEQEKAAIVEQIKSETGSNFAANDVAAGLPVGMTPGADAKDPITPPSTGNGNNNGSSSGGGSKPDPQPPTPKPELGTIDHLRIYSISADNITFKWDAANHAESYRVKTKGAGEISQASNIGNATEFIMKRTDLSNAESFTIYVEAVSGEQTKDAQYSFVPTNIKGNQLHLKNEVAAPLYARISEVSLGVITFVWEPVQEAKGYNVELTGVNGESPYIFQQNETTVSIKKENIGPGSAVAIKVSAVSEPPFQEVKDTPYIVSGKEKLVTVENCNSLTQMNAPSNFSIRNQDNKQQLIWSTPGSEPGMVIPAGTKIQINDQVVSISNLINVPLDDFSKESTHVIKVTNLAKADGKHFDSETVTTKVKYNTNASKWEIPTVALQPPLPEEPKDEGDGSYEKNEGERNTAGGQLPESKPEPEERVLSMAFDITLNEDSNCAVLSWKQDDEALVERYDVAIHTSEKNLLSWSVLEKRVYILPSLMDKEKTYTITIQGVAHKQSGYEDSQAAQITMKYVDGNWAIAIE